VGNAFSLLKKRSELSGFQHNLRRLGALDFALHLQPEILNARYLFTKRLLVGESHPAAMNKVTET
jgi:hypothetical protein